MTELALQQVPALGSIEAYTHAAMDAPKLSPEQEQELARQYRDDGDLDAVRQLIMANLRYVVQIARGYFGYGLAQADLIQEGNIGLMKAVKHFDPERGVRLVSFAAHWIRAEIHEFIIKNWRIVKVATTKAQRKLFFNLRSSKKRLAWLNRNEVNDIADNLGVKPKEVLQMEQRLSAKDIAFDLPADGNSANERNRPAGFLVDEAPPPDVKLAMEQEQLSMREKLGKALEGLDNRCKDIIQKRFLGEAKVTLRELAEQYGVSRERIRQIEEQALKKMRLAIEN